MKTNNRTLRLIKSTLKKNQESLLAKSNVVGVAIGEKITDGYSTGRPAIAVFVEEKVPAVAIAAKNRIEPFIDGVVTDVVEIGTPELLANTRRMRPAIGGISVGHENITAGTFGCLLRSEANGQLYILSNNHILADSNAGRFGDAILQPGPEDGGAVPSDRIATLFRYPSVNPTSDNLVDCALGQPVNPADVNDVILDAWTDVRYIPGWFGAENQGGDIALFDIDGSGRLDLVVFHIDNPAGENHGYYRIGWNLDIEEGVSSWSETKSIPGWFGAEDQGAGIAVADINGSGRPDLIIYHIDNPGGENHGYYRIGWNLDNNGNVTGGWSNIKPIPGWFGAEDQGAGLAIADINGSGRPDMIIFHLDNPSGDNHGYYRIGWDMNRNGDITNWSRPPIQIPGWFGHENQGAGIAIADFTGNHRPDIVVYHIDNPSGENICHYRIGYDIRVNGTVTRWSEARQVSGWAGSRNQGGGIAAGDLSSDGIAELVTFHLDNPTSENHGYYRIATNLGRTGDFVSELNGHSIAGIGLRVWKSGRTTELNNGSVNYTNSVVNIPGSGRFVDQLTISPIVRPGDSGSALVNANNQVVGLIFAASRSGNRYKFGFANRIEHVLEKLRWSDVKAVPGWFGSQNQGADVALSDLNRSGQPDLVVFHIDNPGGENHGYYRIGWDLDGNGDITGGWSNIKPVPGWFGAEDQGAGIAIANISRGRTPDLVIFHIDNPGGENHGYYRIGWNLNNNGDITGGWSNIKPIPGWFGAEDQGAGIAISDINGNGRPDLVVFHLDNPGGENHGYYRIGWNLNTIGNVTGGWSNIKPIPGWFGAEDQGAGIAISDINGNGMPDLVVFHLDNPGGDNHGYYRIGWNLDIHGNVTGGWSRINTLPGWFGHENQGAGVALTNLTGNNRPDLFVFHVDNPAGENHGYYRIAYDLMENGIPAKWTIA